MKINATDAPHIRHAETTRVLMGDAVITMLFLYAMAYYYYGPRAVALGAVSVAAACAGDILCILLRRGKINVRDLSPVVTGMLIPLMMPVTVDYGIVVLAAVFGIVIAKHPFGGVGHNVFNPAAAGYSFAAICFADKLFLYPQPFVKPPVLGDLAEITLVNSPAFTLGLGGVPQYDFIEMALGNMPGPMGATNILVIVACLLYLVFRNTVRWETPVFFFATSGVVGYLMRVVTAGGDWLLQLQQLPYDLMSGIFVLGGVYLLGDPVTSPKRDWSKIGFAVVAGIVVMLFRRYGGLEEGFPFAVLLLNASVWGFDMLGERVASTVRRRRAA